MICLPADEMSRQSFNYFEVQNNIFCLFVLFFHLCTIFRGCFTIDEVVRQVLVDSDSEEEDMLLSSEAETDVVSDDNLPRQSPQSAHGIMDASPQRCWDGSIL